MTEEEKNKIEQTPEGDAASQDETVSKGTKGGMLKYLIFGLSGVAVVVAVIFGVLFFAGDDTQSSKSGVSEEAQTASVEKSESKVKPGKANHDDVKLKEEQDSSDEYAIDEGDQQAIDKIMDNLAFLDYQPSKDEIRSEEEKIAINDSIEQVNWIEKEKEALKKRTAELDAREKDLVKREKDVNTKITMIEQAESNRISKLAKLYDGMDPRAVAQLMMNLQDDDIVSILPRMKGKNASAVLQLIPSKRAAILSKKMITIAGK